MTTSIQAKLNMSDDQRQTITHKQIKRNKKVNIQYYLEEDYVYTYLKITFKKYLIIIR